MKDRSLLKVTVPSDPDQPKPKSAIIGGSHSDDFNIALANSVLQTYWNSGHAETREAELDQIVALTAEGMSAVRPQNELEGMFAAQIVAAHAASMECYRRAALTEQSFLGREMNLKLATKASRTFATLTETLMKLRGESGKQSVHVHHHHHETDNRTQVAAEKAVVNVTAQGVGDKKKQGQPHEPRAIEQQSPAPLDLSTSLRGEEPSGEALPVSSDEGEETV